MEAHYCLPIISHCRMNPLEKEVLVISRFDCWAQSVELWARSVVHWARSVVHWAWSVEHWAQSVELLHGRWSFGHGRWSIGPSFLRTWVRILCSRVELYASLFILPCSSWLDCRNDHLPIDSGGYLSEQSTHTLHRHREVKLKKWRWYLIGQVNLGVSCEVWSLW